MIFNHLIEIEIQAAIDAVKSTDDREIHIMGQSYILGVNRCKNILESILGDEDG